MADVEVLSLLCAFHVCDDGIQLYVVVAEQQGALAEYPVVFRGIMMYHFGVEKQALFRNLHFLKMHGRQHPVAIRLFQNLQSRSHVADGVSHFVGHPGTYLFPAQVALLLVSQIAEVGGQCGQDQRYRAGDECRCRRIVQG